jgi:uncharacterized protein (TIGR00369 family)
MESIPAPPSRSARRCSDSEYSPRVSENPTRREIIEQFIPNSPHAKQLGIRVASLGTDEAMLELPFKPELATIGEVVHGGAIGALIDTAAMAAAWATDEVPESVAGSTVSLSINYAAAASGVAPSSPTGSPLIGLGKNPGLTTTGGRNLGTA